MVLIIYAIILFSIYYSVDRGGSDEVTNRGVNDEVLF